MRVLVCGGRDYNDRDVVWAVLDQIHAECGITVVIHGASRGADALGKQWAIEQNVPELPFPAQWKSQGRAAGPIRNRRMLIEGKPELVVAFPGRDGTANMVSQAAEAGVPVRRIPSENADYRT